MSKLAKKFATIATVITVLAMVVGPVAPAQALTTAELQAQIATLQATLNALTAQLAATTGGTTGTAGTLPAGCASFDRNLKRGMSGADVKCLQQVLNSDVATQVAASGVGSAGSETLYFGALTTAAVNKYQVKQGIVLVGTGFVGTLTRAKLNAGVVGGGTTGTTLPAGCTSTSGYSPTTGLSCGTGTPGTPAGGTVVTGVVNVSLASDNPVSASIVTDSTSADGAQSMIPMLKVNLSNGTASEIKVTQMKFTRSGISADADVSQAYLYDGDTKLAEYNSFSLTVLTFTNSSGVVTIPANSSKTVTLKVDLANTTDAGGKTIKFGINAATDIVSNASSIGGTFPITGNTMTTAQTATLGKLTVAMSTNPAAPDPGTGVEVMKFTLAGTAQKIEVKKIIFDNVGSVAYTDLTNFTLYDSATVVGSVVAAANSDKTVVMTFATPLVIEKGITKTMTLKADIVAGTSRTYKFSFQEMTNIEAYDTQYGIYIKPNQADTWTPLYGTEATIASGKVTASRATDSPNGNIPKDGTNVVLAKFKMKASGEDVKITALTLKLYGTIAATGMYQTTLYYDGSQVGQTTTTMNSGATEATTEGTTFSFGNTFVLPAGTEKVLEVRTDVKRSSGVAHTADLNLTAKITSFTAIGKTSAATISIGSVASYLLTIKAGTITAALNQAVPTSTADSPTGLAGKAGALIGSFVVTAGASEGVDITGIAMHFATTTNQAIQNMQAYKGTKDAGGVQIGSTQSTITANTSYTFYPSTYVSLNASEQFILNVYADILTSAPAEDIGWVVLGVISGTGKTTKTVADSSGSTWGQGTYIGSAAALSFSKEATPYETQVLMSQKDVEFLRLTVSGGVGEDVDVTSITVDSILAVGPGILASANPTPTSTITNIRLYDGTTLIGSAISGLDSNGDATFNLTSNPWKVGEYPVQKTLVIKADINVEGAATSSGASVRLGFATTSIVYRGVESGTEASTSYGYYGSKQYTYKTKLTFAPSKVAGVDINPTTASAGTDQPVFYFDVTNAGEFDAWLTSVTTTMAYTQGASQTATSTASRAFTLYDNADATRTILGATTTDSETEGDATAYNGAKLYINLIPDVKISKGQTRTFRLEADLTDCAAQIGTYPSTKVLFKILNGMDAAWTDGIAVRIATSTSMTFPVSGKSISF